MWDNALINFDYPSSLQQQLQPYLHPYQTVFDPDIITLAQEIAQKAGHDPKQFLNDLNQRIYHQCNYIFRETGQPQSAGITWQQKEGSCRDLAVLFMEVCRVMGLASRFVSGYQEGDPDMQEWDLHAWAEIYLPGAGWRGYDPSQGLIVSDRHIALVASAIPTDTAPIAGDYIPATVELAHPVQSRLNNKITRNFGSKASPFQGDSAIMERLERYSTSLTTEPLIEATEP